MKFNNRDILLVVVAVALLVGTIVLGYFVFKTEDKKESDLRVDDVFFLMESSNTERSRIEIIVFISNIGDKDVGKLEIRAFTVETASNLAMDDSSATINDVIQQTTVEGNLIVDVPNNDTYRMELLIFKDEKLEIRGSGTIDLTGVGASYDYRDYPDYADDDDDNSYGAGVDDEAASLFGGVCILLIIVGVVVGVILYIALKAGNKPPKEGEEFFQNGPPPPPRHMRRMEPKLEEFGDRNMEEQLLEREARRQRSSDRPKPEKVAPPLKEEKKDHKEQVSNNDK